MASLCVHPALARPQAASVKCLDAALGEVHLPCWRFIVVLHNGNGYRHGYSVLFFRWVADDVYPFFQACFFQGIASWNPIYVNLWGSQVLVWHHCRHVLASCWIFLSWLHLLDGEDNCMLSVPYQARATFTTADGKVAKSARRCPPGLSHCCATLSGFL